MDYRTTGAPAVQLCKTTGITSLWHQAPETTLKQTTASLPKVPSSDLAFREGDREWKLALRIPQLPEIWRNDPACIPAILVKAVVVINDSRRLSAVRFLSGDVEIDEGIEAQEHSYEIAIAGEWLPTWKLSDWCYPAPSINPKGELFDGTDGLRLKPDAAIEPGGVYYLLTSIVQTGADRNALPIPSSITHFSLGTIGGWQAWRIQIPFETDEAIEVWCKRLGHGLTISRWKQVIVTPPRRYSPAGLPIFNMGQEVIVALLPPPNAPEPMRSTIRYRAYTPPAPGTYTISDPDDTASPVWLTVMSHQPPPDLTVRPALLRLQILGVDSMQEFAALFDRRAAIQVKLIPSDANDVQVDISCAAPICLSLTVSQSQSYHDRLTAAQTSQILTDALRANLGNDRKLTMQLSAGAFGSLHLEICPLKDIQPSELDEPVLQARWLATLLPALARQADARPLPSTILRTLAILSQRPGFEQLAHVRCAPPELLPRLWTINKSNRLK